MQIFKYPQAPTKPKEITYEGLCQWNRSETSIKKEETRRGIDVKETSNVNIVWKRRRETDDSDHRL